jgi:hypothetical protein
MLFKPLQLFLNVKIPVPRRFAMRACAVLWMSAVVAGSTILWRHSNTAGDPGKVPGQWPATSTLHRSANRKTLVMFAHPKCPCTRTSLGELARLIARAGNGLDAYVVFLEPDGVADDWKHTASVEEAASIPGVTLHFDKDGHEARLFGAATSGQTDLYDANGRLQFSGGITAARGHAGDNAGREAIVEWISTGTAHRDCAPVFGCALDDTQCATASLDP